MSSSGILKITSSYIWYHVRSEENPAGGINSVKLKHDKTYSSPEEEQYLDEDTLSNIMYQSNLCITQHQRKISTIKFMAEYCKSLQVISQVIHGFQKTTAENAKQSLQTRNCERRSAKFWATILLSS